jgi:hypothetical protein
MKPSLLAMAGFALVLGGAFLPWMYVYGHRPLGGFEGGWIIAMFRGHFTDREPHVYPVAWQWGADGWIALTLAAIGLGVAVANRRIVEQRYDRLQFIIGILVCAVALTNILLILAHSGDHRSVANQGGESQDSIGIGLYLTLIGGFLTASGAWLGNTPEFLFAWSDRTGNLERPALEGNERL